MKEELKVEIRETLICRKFLLFWNFSLLSSVLSQKKYRLILCSWTLSWHSSLVLYVETEVPYCTLSRAVVQTCSESPLAIGRPKRIVCFHLRHDPRVMEKYGSHLLFGLFPSKPWITYMELTSFGFSWMQLITLIKNSFFGKHCFRSRPKWICGFLLSAVTKYPKSQSRNPPLESLYVGRDFFSSPTELQNVNFLHRSFLSN